MCVSRWHLRNGRVSCVACRRLFARCAECSEGPPELGECGLHLDRGGTGAFRDSWDRGDGAQYVRGVRRGIRGVRSARFFSRDVPQLLVPRQVLWPASKAICWGSETGRSAGIRADSGPRDHYQRRLASMGTSTPMMITLMRTVCLAVGRLGHWLGRALLTLPHRCRNLGATQWPSPARDARCQRCWSHSIGSSWACRSQVSRLALPGGGDGTCDAGSVLPTDDLGRYRAGHGGSGRFGRTTPPLIVDVGGSNQGVHLPVASRLQVTPGVRRSDRRCSAASAGEVRNRLTSRPTGATIYS